MDNDRKKDIVLATEAILMENCDSSGIGKSLNNNVSDIVGHLSTKTLLTYYQNVRGLTRDFFKQVYVHVISQIWLNDSFYSSKLFRMLI